MNTNKFLIPKILEKEEMQVLDKSLTNIISKTDSSSNHLLAIVHFKVLEAWVKWSKINLKYTRINKYLTNSLNLEQLAVNRLVTLISTSHLESTV